MTYEELLKRRPGAEVYIPEPVPGAVYEDVITTNPFHGMKIHLGTRVTDPATGDRLSLVGHGSDPGDSRGVGNPRVRTH